MKRENKKEKKERRNVRERSMKYRWEKRKVDSKVGKRHNSTLWSEVSYQLRRTFPSFLLLLLLPPISSFSFFTFDLIPLPTIDPRVSFPPFPVLYKITLVTTVSARQGGLIRPLGVLTSLGRTNRFNSLPSHCSPWAACTTNQPSSTQWFHNCRFSFSF